MKRFLIKKFSDKDFGFFFLFFIGVIFFAAVSTVAFGLTAAFSSDVEEYREWFSSGYEVKINDPTYLRDLKKEGVTLYADNEKGLNYDVTISCGDRAENLDCLRRGKVVLNLGEKGLMLPDFRKGDVWLSNDLYVALGSPETGAPISVAGIKCRLAGTYYQSKEEEVLSEPVFIDGELGFQTLISSLALPSEVTDFSFVLYSDEAKVSSYTAIFTDMDQALSFCDKVKDPSRYEDERGVLDYYKGMRFLRGVFILFACFAAFLCLVYYAVTLSVYLLRKKSSFEVARAFGATRGDFVFSVSACFSFASLLGSAFGFLAALGLKRVIDFWASEMIGMTLRTYSLLVLFGCFSAASILAIGVLTFVFSRRLHRDDTVFC